MLINVMLIKKYVLLLKISGRCSYVFPFLKYTGVWIIQKRNDCGRLEGSHIDLPDRIGFFREGISIGHRQNLTPKFYFLALSG